MQVLLERELDESQKSKVDKSYDAKKSEITYRDIQGLSWIFEEDW